MNLHDDNDIMYMILYHDICMMMYTSYLFGDPWRLPEDVRGPRHCAQRSSHQGAVSHGPRVQLGTLGE